MRWANEAISVGRLGGQTHLAGDEGRSAKDDHEDVMEPVDELEIVEEAHMVNMDREYQRRRPVVDCALPQRTQRIGEEEDAVGTQSTAIHTLQMTWRAK